MSVLEIKEKLIEKINQSEDENMLLVVYQILESENHYLEIYKLNPSQLWALNEAEFQIKNG